MYQDKMTFLSQIIFWSFYSLLSLIILYEIILFFLSKLFISVKEGKENRIQFRFLILIPAYKESEILLTTIDAIKKLNYPKTNFKVIVLADECDKKSLQLIQNDVEVVKLELSNHSKVESLKHGIKYIDDFDYVIILDADNLVHPDFLIEINKTINEENKVIQGIRLPKNLDNINEKIDALSDFIYNQLDRIIPASLGLTGTLSGSGFAIKSEFFSEFINSIQTYGGYDKLLQSKLVLKGIKVVINSAAIVFDEKVSSSEVFTKQRSRWYYYHFYNSIKFGFKLLISGILKLNFDQIHLGIKTLRLPLGLMFLLCLILIIVGFFIDVYSSMVLFLISSIFVMIILSILRKENILSFRLLKLIPVILINQFKSFLHLFDAKNSSIKTEHVSKISIVQILNKKET